ncbi:uncharacterized protein [Dysidea avara]|uniref:uncharacterized protein n=1 Tax=Dysidea avara TaxID=196820 RepID=UPI00332F81A4
MEPDDPKTIVDLREVKHPEQKTKYEYFWKEAKRFLDEGIGAAVDDRRHLQITHLSTAISIRDFKEQVQARCPEGTAVPCEEWLRLQFWPKNPKYKTAMHYTGQLKVRFMIQARQFRKTHPDEHYAAALFRYFREFAIKFKSITTMACLDDKRKIKIGEPGFPVAAAERGRRVLVKVGASFEVGDHDFTKFGIIPSVVLINNIPDEFSGSWYRGQVNVSLKECAFEPSSPMRHATELSCILDSQVENKHILLVYMDGGPDHRVTYLSVQVALISLFLKFDLDFVCAARTAPCHSWRNPVERIMSTLNLGLQCVGFMREKLDDHFEDEVKKCNNLKQLRDTAKKIPGFSKDVSDSISHTRVLLTQIMERLQLKDEKIKVVSAASDDEIELMWSYLHTIDDSLSSGVTLQKEALDKKPQLKAFIDHCCRTRKYMFQIKKCGSISCCICKPPKLPTEIFQSINFIPDPVPGEEGHYRCFSDVYGTDTSEEHCPSLKKPNKRRKTLPFASNLTHVRNVDMMLQCEECDSWRLLYSQHKLKRAQRLQLERALKDYTFTCGASMSDLELPEGLNVYARDIACGEPIEKLYYAAKYPPICVYCAKDIEWNEKEYYPQCADCKQPKIQKS